MQDNFAEAMVPANICDPVGIPYSEWTDPGLFPTKIDLVEDEV